jgi:hypothetical protein
MFGASCLEALISRQRNFGYYRYLNKVTQALGDDVYDQSLTALRDVDASIGTKERSPLLAILELDSKRGGGANAVSDQWMKDVETYWSRWGSRQPVVTELENVIAGSEEKLQKVLAMLEEKRNVSHVSPNATDEGAID